MPYNFVIFSLSPWNINIGCNIKDISIELARQNHRVLYIDVPLKRKERWFMKDQPFVKEVKDRHRAGQSLKQIDENLWHYMPDEILESVNSVNSNSLFDAVNYINNKRFAKSIRKAIRAVGFNEYIVLNDNEIYNGFHLKKMLNPSVYMYYLRDMLSAFVYWKRHVSRLEPELISNADVVVTNSEYLSDYAGKFNSKSYYVGQGCDVTQYMQRPPQAEIDAVLKDIPRPIVGYVGSLNAERLNIPLIHELAVKRPELSFVLVGPEDQAFQESKLHEVKNIYFLGKKDMADLPKYIHGFDVAINPQNLNEITIGNYPRKVDEYLAAGVPVVATKTDAMNPFRMHVYLGETAGDYSELITLALKENSTQKSKARVEFAAGHTWKNNVLEMIKALETVKAAAPAAV